MSSPLYCFWRRHLWRFLRMDLPQDILLISAVAVAIVVSVIGPVKEFIMKKLCIIPAIFLALAITLASCDNGTTGSGLTGETVPGSGLAGKLAWLEANAVSGGSYIIELDADESTSRVELDYGGRTGVTIGLRGVGGRRTISLLNNSHTIFWVFSGVTLVLDNNITLKGREGRSVIVPALVNVQGTLVMNEGAVITSHYSDGVAVGGSFTMNGGTISGIARDGVRVGKGDFTMNGGVISGNEVGVVVMYDELIGGEWGTFTMNGGSITGNNTEEAGGGVMMGYIFNMNGGTISANNSYIGGGVFVSASGTFNMSGGTISGNSAAERHGGGVFSWGIFNMTGGTISGNSAQNGGGVGLAEGTFTKTGGTITGNTASEKGRAVSASTWEMGSGFTVIKHRDSGSGPNDNMSYNGKTGAFSGQWDS